MRMILAYHCIFSTYGFWLPNDPRGSWSDWIRAWELLRYGDATKVDTRRSLAAEPHDAAARRAAKASLKFPEVILNGRQARAVARGFVRALNEGDYVVHACSIMPQHVHVIVARHNRKIEQIIGHLKSRATRQLREEGLHPLANCVDGRGNTPSPWSQRKGWTVYLDSPSAILRAIRYVEQNPMREGLPPQPWDFITPFVV